MHFRLEGPALSKARPRFGRNGAVYSPSRNQEKLIKSVFQAQMYEKGYLKLSKQSLAFRCRVCLTPPLSFSHAKKNRIVGDYIIKKPDLDNIIKFYTDAMNGVVYEDDAHIAFIEATKVYALDDCVEIEVNPLGHIIPNSKVIC